VDPAKQYFYCFGCKASGNAIDFVIKRDRVEFKEALISLAKAANIELPKWGAGRENTGERQLLLEAHSAASGFFENLLADPVRGKAAREYLAGRGFNEESIKRFHIGLAPDAWDGLLRSPAMRKFPPEKLALADLVKAREGGNGFYDTFRNRIMFPIRDEGGRIIGFGGRVMPGSDDPRKYSNSSETPLFSKGRVAFGMDLARQKIVETRTVAVVEGYTDVIMAHQYGASNVVSVLGTALTVQHVGLLKRFADRIVLLFDADSAGDAAVDRAVELFLTQPVEVAIAQMPQGKDPDEYLLEHGADGFQKLLDGAQDALEYKWKKLARQFSANENNLTGKQTAVKTYLDLLAGARGLGPIDSIRWGLVLTQVSKLTQIPVDDLNRQFKERPGKGSGRRPPYDRSSSNRSSGHTGNPQEPAQANADWMPTSAVRPTGTSTTRAAERWIMGALLLEAGRWHQVQTRVHVADFSDETTRRLAEIYWAHQRDQGEPVFNEFIGLLDEPGLKELAIDLLTQTQEQISQEQVNLEKGLNDAIDSLIWSRTDTERRRKQAAIGDDPSTEEESLRQIWEMSQLASRRNQNV
jgi:DNA primase